MSQTSLLKKRGTFSVRVLGVRIAHQRRQRQLSQEELARLAGVARETICRIEAGADCRASVLAAVAVALDCSAERLLFGER